MPFRQHDNPHSRMVAWLKLALPMMALGLLSTLFLFSRSVDPEDAIPYADVDVEDRLAQPRMVGAGYAGTTASGAAITLTAEQARPGQEDIVNASNISAMVKFPKGGAITITAAKAELRSQNESALLTGDVIVSDETGYRAQTEKLSLSTTGILAQSDGQIHATGPLGSLRANSMIISAQKDRPENFEMVFTGQVTVLYQPPKELP